MTQTAQIAPSADPIERPAGRAAAKQWIGRQLTADFAPLPVLMSLAVIALIFQALNPRFLSSENLSNLVAQIVPLGFIAAGVVLILLIGEIDLSVGIVSGLAASVMGVTSAYMGWPAYLAVGSAVVVGVVVGAINGAFVTIFGLPSFVVTLAGLLTWQGVMFAVLGSGGSININDPSILWLSSTYIPEAASFAMVAVTVALYALTLFVAERRRNALGLPPAARSALVIRVALLAVALVGAAAILNSARGVSVALVILLVTLVILDLATRRRRFGRHVFAIGGNAEAALRTGVKVRRVRMAVFMVGSSLAAIGGVFAASRLLAVSTGSGGGDVLLNAIAAAVIGGTSLFGGRGSAWAALLGALVIGCISNGMDLLSFEPSTKYIITGLVLLAAVTVDATLRNRYRGRA
jgi:D-xylose transport system permease protein